MKIEAKFDFVDKQANDNTVGLSPHTGIAHKTFLVGAALATTISAKAAPTEN